LSLESTSSVLARKRQERHTNFMVSQAIPIGGSAINVVFVWIWALSSDFFQTRWTLIIAQAVIGLVPDIIMSIWTRSPSSVALNAVYASFFISYTTLGTAPLIMSWCVFYYFPFLF